MRPMTAPRRARWWPLGLGCLAAFVGLPDPAAAQTSTSTFAIKRFLVEFDGDRLNDESQLTTETLFNQARCACANDKKRVRVEIEITTDRNNATESYFVVAGANCLDSENRIVQSATQCTLLASRRIGDQDTNIVFDATVRQLMPEGCTPDRKSLALTVYVGQDQTSVRKLEPVLAYDIDGKAPTAPVKSADPVGGEALATVAFKAGSTSEQDVRYQLLCARLVDGAIAGPWRSTSGTTPIFSSAATVCASAVASSADAGVRSAALNASDGGPIDGGGGDGGSGDLRVADGGVTGDARRDSGTAAAAADSGSSAGGLLDDPRYVCSGGITTTGSAKVQGLSNGQSYRFYVVAVDRAGNASTPVDLGTATPAATQDLWERYVALGGKGTGGYGCAAVTTSRGGISLLLLSGAFALLALARSRRRTPRPAPRQGRQA